MIFTPIVIHESNINFAMICPTVVLIAAMYFYFELLKQK